MCGCKSITGLSAYLCVYKEGDFENVGKRKSWEMEGLERSKVETDSKE